MVSKPTCIWSLNFEGLALRQDNRWTDAVVKLFLKLGQLTHSTFACATIDTGVTLTPNNVSYGPQSKSPALPSLSFTGLPPRRPWLGWYAGKYADLMSPHLGPSASKVGDAWFERISDDPLNGPMDMPPHLVMEPKKKPRRG